MLYATQVYGVNGIRKQQVTVYSPNFQAPTTPSTGSVQVTTKYQFPLSGLQRHDSFVAYANLEHTFAHQWRARMNFYYGEDYDAVRLRNVNAPQVPSSGGPEPDPLAALRAPRRISKRSL